MTDLATTQDLGDLYADFSACILAIASALEQKNVLSNAELRAAAQERLLTLDAAVLPSLPYAMLRMMATSLPTKPDE